MLAALDSGELGAQLAALTNAIQNHKGPWDPADKEKLAKLNGAAELAAIQLGRLRGAVPSNQMDQFETKLKLLNEKFEALTTKAEAALRVK
jgi:hypothetical protein